MKNIIILVILLVTLIGSFYLVTTLNKVPNAPKNSSDITTNAKYIIDNPTYRFRLKEVTSDGFAIREVPLIEEKGSSIEISPTKPRAVDFAWASVRISLAEPKVPVSDLVKDSYVKKQMFGTTVYYKELSDPNYTKEYIVENDSNQLSVKVYLNNSSTKSEFDPVINVVLQNLEFY